MYLPDPDPVLRFNRTRVELKRTIIVLMKIPGCVLIEPEWNKLGDLEI